MGEEDEPGLVRRRRLCYLCEGTAQASLALVRVEEKMHDTF